MRPDGTHETYSTGARHLHWWTVLLIAIQLPLGIVMVRYAAQTNWASPTALMYDSHKLIGLLALVLVLARLTYRLRNGAPADEPTLEPWQRLVSHATHWGIYVLLLVVPLLGWLSVSAYGSQRPFGLPVPALVGQSEALYAQFQAMHKAAAILLAVLVAMHIGAALFHYVIRKDGVLNRMWPGLPRRDGQ